MNQKYSDVDAQLLIEVRIAAHQGKPLPMGVVRILVARGWAHAPRPSEVIEVRAALEDDPDATLDEYSQSLARPRMTRTGESELALHRRYYDDDLLQDFEEVEDAEELDEWDEEDD